MPTTPLMFALTAGVLIGMAQAGTTYAVVYGVIGRNVSAEQALLGHGRRGGGRLLRPVPDGADRRLADQQLRLAAGAGGPGLLAHC